MSRDANGPFQLSGSIATASLKQRLLAQRAANQDAAVISTRKPAVVDLSKSLLPARHYRKSNFFGSGIGFASRFSKESSATSSA